MRQERAGKSATAAWPLLCRLCAARCGVRDAVSRSSVPWCTPAAIASRAVAGFASGTSVRTGPGPRPATSAALRACTPGRASSDEPHPVSVSSSHPSSFRADTPITAVDRYAVQGRFLTFPERPGPSQ
jgi:hypothetical protein